MPEARALDFRIVLLGFESWRGTMCCVLGQHSTLHSLGASVHLVVLKAFFCFLFSFLFQGDTKESRNCHPCVMLFFFFPVYQHFVSRFAMAVLCVYRINI